MTWKLNDFKCEVCYQEFEFLQAPGDDRVFCSNCASKRVKKILSTPNLASFSMLSTEGKQECLQKRSSSHTKKLMNDTPEKWGAEGKRKARQDKIASYATPTKTKK